VILRKLQKEDRMALSSDPWNQIEAGGKTDGGEQTFSGGEREAIGVTACSFKAIRKREGGNSR